MKVKHWMTREVITASPRDSLFDVEKLLRRHEIRQVPVVVGEARLVGILTDRDVRDAMPSSFNRNPVTMDKLRGVHVEDIMTVGPHCVYPESDLREVAMLLMIHRIGGLPVVEGDKLVGIITRSDLLRSWVELAPRLQEFAEDHTMDLLPPDIIIEQIHDPMSA